MTDKKELLTVKEFLQKYPYFSKRYLAQALGISENMMIQYSKDRCNPSDKTLRKMNNKLEELSKSLQNIEFL